MILIAAAARLRGRVRGADVDDGQDGVTLIEVVVSLVVFALFSTALVGSLIFIQTTSRNDRLRVSAANVAQAQVESLRDLPTAQIPVGQRIFTTTVDSVTFTITQNVQYVTETAQSSCLSTAAGGLAYKRITEVVSWAGMGAAKPVRTDSLRSININGLDQSKGSFAVQVNGAGSVGSNSPQSGVPVTVTATGFTTQTVNTGDDGCAVFTGLPGGVTATAVAARSGYVGLNHAATTSVSATIVAAAVAKASMTYASAATGVFSLSPASSLGIALTVKNGNTVTPIYDCAVVASVAPCATGQPRSVALYPQTGDLVWAGTCADADPGLPANGSTTSYEASPTLAYGQTASAVTVRLGSTTVTNAGTSTKSFYAIHVPDASCAKGEAYALGTISAGATNARTFSLPYGTWYVTSSTSSPVTYSYSSTTDGQATLTPSGGTVAVAAS